MAFNKNAGSDFKPGRERESILRFPYDKFQGFTTHFQFSATRNSGQDVCNMVVYSILSITYCTLMRSFDNSA